MLSTGLPAPVAARIMPPTKMSSPHPPEPQHVLPNEDVTKVTDLKVGKLSRILRAGPCSRVRTLPGLS